MIHVPRKYWIGVVSRAHIRIGVRGGFLQLNPAKKAPLQRMNAGDGITIYSPRTDYPDGDILQHFTYIGIIKTGEIYQVEMSPDFIPFRRDVRYLECKEAPIRPLIDRLSFIKDKTKWGAAFRFGHLNIPREDFRFIAQAMGVDVTEFVD